MQKHRRLFHIGGGVLLSLCLLGGTMQAAAEEKPKQDVGGTMLAAAEKAKEGDKGKECKEGLPCQKHRPIAGDTAEGGDPCTDPTGWVCNTPGQPCGMNNVGTCHTYSLGSGKCTCACVMP